MYAYRVGFIYIYLAIIQQYIILYKEFMLVPGCVRMQSRREDQESKGLYPIKAQLYSPSPCTGN